jgi:hypothetical protein
MVVLKMSMHQWSATSKILNYTAAMDSSHIDQVIVKVSRSRYEARLFLRTICSITAHDSALDSYCPTALRPYGMNS